MEDHRWVTLDELAERLGVNKRTIMRWWREDKIEIVKLSWKSVVIAPDEAERVVSEYRERFEARLNRINGRS